MVHGKAIHPDINPLFHHKKMSTSTDLSASASLCAGKPPCHRRCGKTVSQTRWSAFRFGSAPICAARKTRLWHLCFSALFLVLARSFEMVGLEPQPEGFIFLHTQSQFFFDSLSPHFRWVPRGPKPELSPRTATSCLGKLVSINTGISNTLFLIPVAHPTPRPHHYLYDAFTFYRRCHSANHTSVISAFDLSLICISHCHVLGCTTTRCRAICRVSWPTYACTPTTLCHFRRM